VGASHRVKESLLSRRNAFRNILAQEQFASSDFHVCFGYELRYGL
jgi:hypothetical protein